MAQYGGVIWQNNVKLTKMARMYFILRGVVVLCEANLQLVSMFKGTPFLYGPGRVSQKPMQRGRFRLESVRCRPLSNVKYIATINTSC